MAHDISGTTWIVDTSAAGLVSSKPAYIKHINVTWKTSSIGVLEFSEGYSESSVGSRKFLSAETAGASTAAWDQLTQQFLVGRIMQNVWLTTASNIKTCHIVTE